MPILSGRVGTVRKWECAYESSGGNMLLLQVRNMTKFVNYLRPIFGHLRPKYVILLNYHASNSESQHCFVKMIFLNCNCIYVYTYELENERCLPPTLWTCPLLRLMD